MKKLQKELKEVDKRIADIAFKTTMRERQTVCEKKLWMKKRKILAELDPFNA